MADPAVARWSQNGAVYLWRYTEGQRNYPGWHFAADQLGGQSVLALLDLMQNARWPSKPVLRLTCPTRRVLSVVGNRGGDARFKHADSLLLHYDGQLAPDAWQLTSEATDLILRLGANRLLELRGGIQDLLAGRGDYCIGPGDEESFDAQCLWFWWMPDE